MPRAKGGSIPPPRVLVPPGHGGPIAELNVHDVLSGRGGRINNHPGNVAFRTIVEGYKKEYLDPRTRKLEKAHVAARLVAQIRSTRPSGRFLREDPQNPGKYVEIGDQKAWKKAGQAMREDAPDVRKEIGEDLSQEKQGPLLHAAPPLMQQQLPAYQQQAYQQQQQQPAYQQQQQPLPYAQPQQQPQQQPPQPQYNHRPGVPPGIPPSVSYSPTAAPVPLAPVSAAGARPDPPEAVGVTGYRQPPLRYIRSRSGRGAPGRGGAPIGRTYSGRGGGRHHQGFYNHPLPSAYSPHGPSYGGGPLGQPRGPAGGGPRPSPPPPSGPPPPGPPPVAYYPSTGPGPHPQDAGGSHRIPGATRLSHGVHHTMDFVTHVAHKVAHPPAVHRRDSAGTSGGFRPFQSTATDFTMSDISTFEGFDGSLKRSANAGGVAAPFGTAPLAAGPNRDSPRPTAAAAHYNPPVTKQSTNTTSSGSTKSRELSFTMSEIMGSGVSFSRTRSFPDLLSSGDLLPPMQSDASDSDREGEKKEQRALPQPKAGARQQSSSGSSDMGGFHPVGPRAAGGGSGVPGPHAAGGHVHCPGAGLGDAMSIMSLDSRRSAKSFRSELSWLDNLRSMTSVHSDQMKEDGIGLSLVRPSLQDGNGSDGSVRSFLSDVSAELYALDLAEPLLPPLTNPGLHDSGEFMVTGPEL